MQAGAGARHSPWSVITFLSCTVCPDVAFSQPKQNERGQRGHVATLVPKGAGKVTGSGKQEFQDHFRQIVIHALELGILPP